MGYGENVIFSWLQRLPSQNVLDLSGKNAMLKQNSIPKRNSQSTSRGFLGTQGDDSRVEPIC